MCTPVNPINSEIRKIEDLILIKFDYDENNRFINTHYLQNLIYIYEKVLQNNNEFSSITNKDAILEFKYKVNKILESFYKKINKLNEPKKKNELTLINNLNYNFENSEVFTKNTSFTMLNFTVRLLTSIILIFNKKLSGGYIHDKIDSPSKNISAQQYTTYFFEILIELENNLKTLLNNENYFNYYKRCSHLSNEIENFKTLLSKRIKFIKSKINRENLNLRYTDY